MTSGSHMHTEVLILQKKEQKHPNRRMDREIPKPKEVIMKTKN